EQRVFGDKLSTPHDALRDCVLVDRAHTIARMERNERLPRELIDRETLSVDTKRGILGHDVADATGSNDIDQTCGRVVFQTSKAQTRTTLRLNTLVGDEGLRNGLIRQRVENPQVRIASIARPVQSDALQDRASRGCVPSSA